MHARTHTFTDARAHAHTRTQARKRARPATLHRFRVRLKIDGKEVSKVRDLSALAAELLRKHGQRLLERLQRLDLMLCDVMRNTNLHSQARKHQPLDNAIVPGLKLDPSFRKVKVGKYLLIRHVF